MIILSELSASHGCEMDKTNTTLCQSHLDTEEKINKNNPGKGIFFPRDYECTACQIN